MNLGAAFQAGAGRAGGPDRSCDYLLFVGPGRSATTYIYRTLSKYYGVTFRHIKESHYYRSLRRYRRARARIPREHLLGDIANDAYLDPKLPGALERLKSEGVRVLVVVTLRDHVERARSMMQFDTNRGRALWPGGTAGLEARVVNRRLTPAHLQRIYSTGTDVAVVDFNVLTVRPQVVLNRLASECGIPACDAELESGRVNASERSRSVPLTGAAVLLGKALRATGCRRTLQRLKDNRRIHGWFFKPMPGADRRLLEPPLAPGHVALLRRENHECWKLVRQRSTLEVDGVFRSA